MKILFIHQNMPGQYKHMARRLAAEDGNQVVFVTKRDDRDIPNVRRITYRTARGARKETHLYLRSSGYDLDDCLRRQCDLINAMTGRDGRRNATVRDAARAGHERVCA